VITPPFNPNDIAGTQGGGRPPVRIPFPGGGFGTGEPQILNGRPTSVSGVGGARGERGPQPTGGGSTVPQTQPKGPGMWMDNPSAPGGKSWVGADFSSQQAGGASSYDQMVAQQNQRANDSYNAQVAAGGHQDYFNKVVGPYKTSGTVRGNADAPVGRPAGLAGLSSQAVSPRPAQVYPQGPSTGMPMAPNQSMAQAPQSLPMAPGGLNSLATKAKRPQNITLNQMYRK
jgi:hypothetical protein